MAKLTMSVRKTADLKLNLYLDYFEEDKLARTKYLVLARTINKKLQPSFKNLGESKVFATMLRKRVEKYNKLSV